MGIPLEDWSGSGATKGLQETILRLSDRTERQTKVLIRLTWVLVVLTVVVVGLTIVLVVRG
jgi:hypothetical protein